MGIYEWTNRNKITPYAKITFSSSLEAMLTFGVKVYFVNSEQFESYLKLPDDMQEVFFKGIKLGSKKLNLLEVSFTPLSRTMK